jgi:hypothetical protein
MSNNTEFQVGDRVEFTAEYKHFAKQGEQATVVGHHEKYDNIVTVETAQGRTFDAYRWRLKHVEATPVPKEFRFFRRSDAAISTAPFATFEDALAGWRAVAMGGDEVEIIEIVSHGSYKAVLKIEEA